MNVAQDGPLLTPKASAATWVVMGISIFLLVAILALGIQLAWITRPQPYEAVTVETVSNRTIPRSRFTQRSKMSRFANAQ